MSISSPQFESTYPSEAAERNIVIAHYRPDIVSGAERSIADLVEQISPRFHITMLVPGEGKLAKFYRKLGMDVWVKNVETPRRLYPGLHQIQSWQLASAFRSRAVDAVLCNTFPSASRVATACQISHIPYAIFMRDYIPDSPLHRKILSQANMLLAISKDVIQQHSELVPLDHFRLSYNYIDREPLLKRAQTYHASGQRLLPFDPKLPIVGLVGRITPYKQPEVFVKAIPQILSAVPEARFVIIGAAQAREKPYEDSIHQLAEEIGITDKVAFLGQRPDAVELTSEMTIACLCSRREPLGRVVLEAQLLRIPVVVPDTGGPAEIVQDGVTGLHFSATAEDAPQQLANQVIRLLEDAPLRKTLAQNGYEQIVNTFANHIHVEIQEDFIEQLCSQPEIARNSDQ